MSVKYTPLSTDDHLELGDGLSAGSVREDTTRREPEPLPVWLKVSCSVTILAVLMNLLGSRYESRSFGKPPSARLELYRPNMYIGLERLSDTTPQTTLPSNIDVFPHIFAPISRAEPDRVFPSDGRSRITFNGLVSPGEPHIIINKDISMIAQIYVQDYGYQQCSIAAVIPDQLSLDSHNRTLTLTENPTTIHIWDLDSSGGPLDLKRLSWRNRPSRIAHLSEVTLRRGQTFHSAEFDCGGSGSLRTFEFTCETDAENCSVEFWQEQPETKPRMAIIIVQTPSTLA